MSSRLFGVIQTDVPVLVHSDIAEAVGILGGLGIAIDRSNLGSSIVEALGSLLGVEPNSFYFPAFNYDFGVSRVFNVDRDPVQVGGLPEMLRRSGYYRRTPVPFFSFLEPARSAREEQTVIDPFGDSSFFGELDRRRGYILMFGVDIRALTFIHHIESSVEGGPLYRYDKRFSGEIVEAGVPRSCVLNMHVRPLNLGVEYDWEKIAQELIAGGAMWQPPAFKKMSLIFAPAAKDIMLRKIAEDPLYLLTGESRVRLIDQMGGSLRKLDRADFE